MAQTTKISCPKCGNEFNVEDVIAHQLEEKYRKELNSKISSIEDQYKSKEEDLAAKEKKVREKETDIENQLRIQLSEKSILQEAELKEKIKKDYELEIVKLESAASEAKKAKIENEKLKRELYSQKEDLELEYEKKMTEELSAKSAEIIKKEAQRAEMKVKELEKKLEDQTNLVEQMRQKAEQGSMQLQGEVQELAIENILKEAFPFDEISEVSKGVRGADIVHKVKNRLGNVIGTIVYESKRTKTFSNDWTKKLKSDALLVKADICVLISEVIPDNMERAGLLDGVWVSTFNDFRPLIIVLRESLIKISEAYSSQTNKGEKMQMLYDYLTGNEFRLQIENIISGFTDLQKGYLDEKVKMERIWKEREKQLEKILLNTNHFIGSVKGIVGNSISGMEQIGSTNAVPQINA